MNDVLNANLVNDVLNVVRLEIERWVESLINATLDISKMFLTIMGEEVPETSREVLFRVGGHIYEKEKKAETFSELARIRNTLAHRYLDLKWNDIKRFLEIAPLLYPSFLDFIRKQIKSRDFHGMRKSIKGHLPNLDL